MPKRKIKESLFDSSEKEHIQLLHHFIIKIISNFDSFGKNRTEPLFDMYDLHAKKALVDTVFKPDEKKLRAMNNEDEDHYRRRKSRYWDEPYHCPKAQNIYPKIWKMIPILFVSDFQMVENRSFVY